MAKTTSIEIYLEIGSTRTFAAAINWPGWSRSGRDEAAAIQSLCDYGSRYAQVLSSTRLKFSPPPDISAFKIVERLEGNATTDFGALSLKLPSDTEPVEAAELKRWHKLLQACWDTFDKAVDSAEGHSLRKGPRGGGRDLDKIIEHVRDVNNSYLKNLGGTLKLDSEINPSEALTPIREAILTTLDAAVKGEIPDRGPRGGLRWTPRYFVRRLAWHELDHTWEIEDRIE